MIKNPVMFVTMVGAVLTTVGIFTAEPDLRGFVAQLALWLWFTVLFANFAEAVAEGRGKAQAASSAEGAQGNDGAPPAERPRRKSSAPDLAERRSRGLRSGRRHSGGRRRHRRHRQRR